MSRKQNAIGGVLIALAAISWGWGRARDGFESQLSSGQPAAVSTPREAIMANLTGDPSADAPAALAAAMAHAVRLGSKALPTAKERAELRQAWSNPALVELAQATLLAEGDVRLSERHLGQRLAALDFLFAAARWGENPAADQVTLAAEALIARDLSQLEMPEDLRKSLAGDQIEMMQIVMRTRKSLALRMIEEFKDQAQGKLIAYAIELEKEGAK